MLWLFDTPMDYSVRSIKHCSYLCINKKYIMNRDEILNILSNLAKSQGTYARLYNQLSDGSEDSEKFITLMESQGFNDVVDIIMWLEE